MANPISTQYSSTANLGTLAITSIVSGTLFLKLVPQYPILKRLSNDLSIADIVALTRTHKKLEHVYQQLVANCWNVDQTLRRFVSDAARFRSQMAKHITLVFGSIPLQFFARVVWEESDMDIIIKGKEYADAFGTYLSQVEGYQLVDYGDRDKYHIPDRLETKTYIKWKRLVGSAKMADKKIQIVCSENEAVSAILRSHTTVVINFFSWNKAYAIYPLSTIIHREGYMLKSPDWHINTPNVAMEMIHKYTNRGWKFRDVAWPEERHFHIDRPIRKPRRAKLQDVVEPQEGKPHTNHPIRDSRRVGDKYTWIIPFDTTYVEGSEVPDYVLEYTVFTLKKEFPCTPALFDERRLRYYTVGLAPYAAATLYYRYTFGDWDWISFLESMLASKAHERPLLKNPGFVRPDDWTYWDDYVPDFYLAWKESKAKKISAVAESSGKKV